MVCLHRTDRRKLVTIFIIQLYRQKYLFRVLDTVDVCTEGIVLQQSNLVDSTVTLHLQLVVRNKRWNSLQVEQEAVRTKKMLARFLKNCESIVSQGVDLKTLRKVIQTCGTKLSITNKMKFSKGCAQ